MKTVAELAAHVGGQVEGDGSRPVHGVNGLSESGPEELAFYANPRYRRALASTQAAAVVVAPEAQVSASGTMALIRVKNPYLAFAQISALFSAKPRPPAGISDRAQIHSEAWVDPTATVMGLATVERGARIGPRTVLYPGVYIGEAASVGADCLLYPQAVVLERCHLGDRVTLHASVVIGADGFGYAFDPGLSGSPSGPSHYKVPQVGTVRLEDDVEIGASSCVDRGTLGETLVGRGSKLDNLVQVGHNVRVGPLTILCGQVGIAGSTELGQGVVMAGQSGAANHLTIGKGVRVGAQSAVLADVEAGKAVSGTPAIDHAEWLRAATAFGGLAELLKEVRRLRRRVEALEKQDDGSA